MEKCPKCDNERKPNNMECPHCGIVYEKYDKRKANNKENHKRLKGILGLIYLGIFTLLSIAIINYIFPDKQSPQAPPPISPEGDILSSLEASINYLSQPKFAQMISSVKDKGGVCMEFPRLGGHFKRLGCQVLPLESNRRTISQC